MGKAFFDVDQIDPDALRRVATQLTEIGFTEAGVRDRLALRDICELKLEHYPYYLNYRLRRRSPLDVAIMLFLLQASVTEEQLGELFEREQRRVLRKAKVLAGDRKSRSFRARISLYPVGERLFFADHRFAHDPWVKARVPRNPVMYAGIDSHYLARATIQRPVRSVLDICCGAGIHAVMAAGSTERAVGVDINPRAVNFARLNAMLNDAWNAVFVEGDLFTPVSGERFDLVVAHPPFVPSPVYEVAYRDGGPSGADVLRRIIASLPDYLTTSGVAQIVTHIAEREGEPYLERIRRWLGGANLHIHSLRLGERDVVDYAEEHVREVFGERYGSYESRLVEWITNLRSQRFRRLVTVVLTMQWNDEAPHPPWTQEDEVKDPPRTDMSHELNRLLSARREVRRLKNLAELDPMRVGIPDDVLLIERRRPTGAGFETKDFRVMFRDAVVSPELDIKPLVRDLLERVDNRSTVPEVIGRLARDTGQDAGEIDERCRRALLVMYERGLVTLDAMQGEAPGLPLQVTPRDRTREDEGEGPDDLVTPRSGPSGAESLGVSDDGELNGPAGTVREGAFDRSTDSYDPDGAGHTLRE